MKTCTGCGIEKPLEAFWQTRGSCRQCWALKSKAWRAANHARAREHERAYRERNIEAVRAKDRAYSKRLWATDPARAGRWRINNPERVKRGRLDLLARQQVGVPLQEMPAELRELFNAYHEINRVRFYELPRKVREAAQVEGNT